MIPKSDWVYYGFAGHFICARRCAYHLCTRIGGRLVSTVGALYPSHSAQMETLSAGKNAYYETHVFECDGEDDYENPNIKSWTKLESHHYATSQDAERGHREICDRIGNEESVG